MTLSYLPSALVTSEWRWVLDPQGGPLSFKSLQRPEVTVYKRAFIYWKLFPLLRSPPKILLILLYGFSSGI